MPAGAASSQTGPREMEEEEKVYVAVVKQVKEGKANLTWAIQNTSKYCKIVLLHVHQPAKRIPTALGWFPASQLEDQEVAAYRRMERDNMHGNLDEYVNMCSQVKVHKTEKLVVVRDDIAEGLIESIVSHGITKLVIGAAASKNYSRKMKAPWSKMALAVQQKAHPSCKIWFICKGNLICTREALLDGSIVSQSFTASPISKTSQSGIHRPISASLSQGGSTNCSSIAPGKQDIVTQRSLSDNLSLYQDSARTTSPTPSKKLVRSSTTESRESKEPARSTSESKGNSVVDPLDAVSSFSDHFVFDEEKSNMASLSTMQEDADREGASLILQVKHEPEEFNKLLSPRHDQVNLGVDDVLFLYEKLQIALDEAESFAHEAYEEFYKRQKAEKDLNKAVQKTNLDLKKNYLKESKKQGLLSQKKRPISQVKIVQNLYNQEFKQRIGIEEALAKEKLGLLALKKLRDEVYEELKKAHQKMEALQLQNSDSDRILKDIKKKLSEAYSLLDSIRQEHDVLQQEQDKAMRENQELKRMKEEVASSILEADNFSVFSLSELEQATENFKEESKIGEGGYGCVYKGFLRHTAVAIKRLNPQGMQGKAEFQREMNVLSKVRHPNLVTLIGACPEAWALVYEFLPNGSLEDHLNCKKNTPPLTWQTRIRIAADICSALIFLHSCKPFSVVHGDLKPGNILLDANFASKLGDFGICRLLVQSISSTTLYHCTRQPKGTFAYMDPELLTSGEITIKSDMYSFGVILLRLLTGRPAFGVSKVVQEAWDKNCLHKILDGSAGDWPYLHAEKLAKVGLKCCEMKRRNRPDATEAWRILHPLTKSSFSGLLLSYRLTAEDSPYIPSYFICPILKEPMKDPQIAADGFTYEAEAIEGWFASGHDTSPMTNLKLDHHELIPNHTLRHAIQGWLPQIIQNSSWDKESASTTLSSTDV